MNKFTKAITAIVLIAAATIVTGCNKPDEPNNGGGNNGNNDSDVRVTTYTPQEITQTTAACGGDVIVTQGLTLTKLGVCWSMEQNPTINDNNLSTTDWNAPFVCTLYHLNPNTTYHVRAFALRGLEYYYGEGKAFTTLDGGGGSSGDTIPENPDYPNAIINFTIYPNSLQYQELNYISGWLYLTSVPETTSRGLIVYRVSENEFLAYDRLPPNYPNACADEQGNTTRLVVDFPFVVDYCNNAYYNILNGQIVISEEQNMVPNFSTELVYPLFQYHTNYDGNKLVITN